mgnify:CR=1 FL=1
MATGVPHRDNKQRKIPIELVYSGKKEDRDILETQFRPLNKISCINGENENKFFFDDLIHCCICYIPGTKKKSN